MHASNTALVTDSTEAAAPVQPLIDGLWAGALGRTVRCVPWRRTVMVRWHGELVFAKLYTSRVRAAGAEWRWLAELPALGVRCARPLGARFAGRRAMVVMAAVPGRSLDVWFEAARAAGAGMDGCFDYLCREVAPLLRRLHERRLVHRDLNLAHLFVERLEAGSRPTLIDLERVMRPRWRWRRWLVKDLASLLASVPVQVPLAVQVRFARSMLPGSTAAWRRRLGAQVLAKAARIRRHQPRFG